MKTEEQGHASKWAHTPVRSYGKYSNHPQCRGRPMCLPENASKRKKYSSTASGPTGSPSVMIEEEFEDKRTERKKHANNGRTRRCAPTAKNNATAM